MSIKKISQLDHLLSDVFLNEDGSFKTEQNDKMLFETSYYIDEIDQAPSYYRSYYLTLKDFKDIIGVTKIWETLSSIVSGDITITGPTKFGKPIDSHVDKDDCTYWNDNILSDYVIIYDKLSCNNLTKFYDEAEFHNIVTIRGSKNKKHGATVKYMPGAILSCQGQSYFDNPINGIAMSAWWADLAEYYEADDDYDPGTLVEFGGPAEITIAIDKCNAVVTSKPGLVLNASNKPNMTGIALAGRTPIKVLGKVKKFDDIILSDKPGIGIVNTIHDSEKIIGKALESSDDEDIKLIECVTKFNLE